MPTQREYKDRLASIRAASAYQWVTVTEARQCLDRIRLTLQELRTLKSDLRLDMQHIRSDFTAKRAGVRADLMAYWLKISTLQRVGKREDLRQKELKELVPYQQLVREADDLIHALNHTRLEIQRWLTANKR